MSKTYLKSDHFNGGGSPTVDAKAKTFSAYMGDVAKLPSPKCIPMHPCRDVPNHKCLTKNQSDDEISETWSNVVGTVSG